MRERENGQSAWVYVSRFAVCTPAGAEVPKVFPSMNKCHSGIQIFKDSKINV